MTEGFQFMYKCACGTHELRVRYRGKTEDIVDYMEQVLRVAVSTDHAIRFPACKQTTSDLILPLNTAASSIGMAVEH